MPNILIIDDDASISEMLSEALENEGYTVSKAYSETEAMMFLSQSQPDLVLLDLMLPSFDGISELLKLVGLDNTGRKKAKNFSLGMRQRLGIAVALCGNPDFLVLDEPINGLDPQGIIEIRELILKLNREQKITVLISSHILDELSRLATHYGFIDSGSIVREMSADELEAACRKCMRMTVTDTAVLARVLDDMGIDYKIIDAKTNGLSTYFSHLSL